MNASFQALGITFEELKSLNAEEIFEVLGHPHSTPRTW
jgi:predicted phosphoribosyltransferase